MTLSKLTKKERIVFSSLTKYPNLTDREISEKIGIKRSTVTSIKNRLKAEGYYKTVVIPNLPAIGCKIIGFMHTRFTPTAPREARKASPAFEATVNHPELVFARSTDTEFVGIYCGKDLYSIKKVQDFLILDYESRDFVEEVNRIYYPIEMAEINSFFNYVPLLQKLFGTEPDKFKQIWKKTEEVDLNSTEKIVLNAVVKWPELNNLDLAKKINKTRSTVSKTKKDLVKRGLITVAHIPLMTKLGCELLVYIHVKFNPKCPISIRREGVDLSLVEALPIIDVTGDIESGALWVFENYTKYMEIYNKIIGYFKEKNYLAEKPFTLVFPIEKLKWRKMDFSNLTEKLLFEKQ